MRFGLEVIRWFGVWLDSLNTVCSVQGAIRAGGCSDIVGFRECLVNTLFCSRDHSFENVFGFGEHYSAAARVTLQVQHKH